jgi:beta-glucosidase
LFPAQQLVHQPVQSFQTTAYNAKKKAFVDQLVAKMTLDEKIGQRICRHPEILQQDKLRVLI